jgi:APA family basic amino acid/polyamine antiporter
MVERLRSIQRKVIIEKEKLKRQIGVLGLFSTAYGNIGSSIYYALGATAFFALGATPIVIAVVGIFFVFNVFSFSEGSCMLPYAGGASSFARKGFNEVISFFTGWVDLLSYVATIAISSVTAVYYAAYFFPVLKEPIPITIGKTISFSTDPNFFVILFAIFIVLALMVLNIIGVKEAMKFNILFAVIDILTQILIVIIGAILLLNIKELLSYPTRGPDFWPDLKNLIYGFAVANVAYTGIDTISQMAEETSDYKVKIPKAYILLIIVVLFIYLTLPVVSMSAMGPKELATTWHTDPIAGIAYYMPEVKIFGYAINLKMIFGPWIAFLAVSILIIATNAGIIGASRLAYSMGQYRQLPSFIFKLHRKFNTPYKGIIFFCMVAIGLLLSGLIYKDIFIKLAILYSFATIITFTVSDFSIIAMRIKFPEMERPFKIPLNFKFNGREIPIPMIIDIIFNTIVWLILIAGNSWASFLGFLWIIVGLVLYVVYRKKYKLPVFEEVSIERVVEVAYLPIEYEGILVPTVGELDAEMIQAACKMALKDKSNVTALYVIEVPMTLPIDAKIPSEIEKAQKVMDQADLIGKEYGVQVNTRIIQTRSAGKAIVEEAEKMKASLILLGKGEREKRVEELISGKTINYVAKNAPCPVWTNIAENT